MDRATPPSLGCQGHQGSGAKVTVPPAVSCSYANLSYANLSYISSFFMSNKS